MEKPWCINVHFLLEEISIAMLDHQGEIVISTRQLWIIQISSHRIAYQFVTFESIPIFQPVLNLPSNFKIKSGTLSKSKGSNLSTIMSVKSSDMMSNSKTAICTKPPKFEKCQQKNLTPKKQGLWVTSPNKHPGVFTTLASPAAARASASAAFKTAGWAGSLGVFQKSGEKTSWGWCVFIPLFTYRFKNMLGGWPWGILNQQYVDPICFYIESSLLTVCPEDIHAIIGVLKSICINLIHRKSWRDSTVFTQSKLLGGTCRSQIGKRSFITPICSWTHPTQFNHHRSIWTW